MRRGRGRLKTMEQVEGMRNKMVEGGGGKVGGKGEREKEGRVVDTRGGRRVGRGEGGWGRGRGERGGEVGMEGDY